jgi:hypothetical protein
MKYKKRKLTLKRQRNQEKLWDVTHPTHGQRSINVTRECGRGPSERSQCAP